MNRRWLKLGALGLLVYLLALTAGLPAGWGLHLAAGRLPGGLHWGEATGSVFDARVLDLAVVLPDGRRAVFDSVELDTSPLPLLMGRLHSGFTARGYGGEITGYGRAGQDSWSLGRVQGGVSLADLMPLAPELALAGVSGRLIFRGRDLSGGYRGLPRSGRLEATLTGLDTALLEVPGTLGDYALDLQADGEGGIRGRVETVSAGANLHLSGRLQLDGSRLLFEGQGRAGPDAPESLREMLPLLGEMQDGRARINWQMSL